MCAQHERRLFSQGYSIGKTLLAELSHSEVQDIMQKRGLPSFIPSTLTSSEALFEYLEKIRARGWSIDNEERNIGIRCLAASIYNTHRKAVAGISISEPSVRMTDEVLGEFDPLVKRIAAKITEAVGNDILKYAAILYFCLLCL